MQIMTRIFTAVMITVVLLSICSFTFVSRTIKEPKVDIELLIGERLTKEIADERYNTVSFEKPEKYTYDTSVYLLEYNVGTDYWNSITENNYTGLTEAIDYSYPTVYIPVFGDISDTSGEIHNRVIGYFKLDHDSHERDYRFSSAFYNLPGNDYKDRKNVGFFEKIQDFVSQNSITSEQVFLIKYPSSLSDDMEKIAVIKTADDTLILDVSGSVNANADKTAFSEVHSYSVSEYRTLRLEAEKELYNKENNYGILIIVCVFTAVLFLCALAFLLIRRRFDSPNK